MQIGLGRIRGAAAQTRCQAMAREERPVKLGQAQSVAADTQRACLSTRPRATTTHARRCPVWPRRPTHSRTARNVPRTSTNARLGEALSGSQDLHAHAPLHTFRERPRTHAWPKPCLAGTTYTLMHRSQRSESDDEPTHGRSPVWPQRPTTPGPLAVSRERSGTHAWAKPCLAGRPTMLVRTQSPEQNTSRGRPSGMELPDYPVVATRPIPQDQDGPTPPLPTGSFPGFVSRYASRPVFSVLVTRSASRPVFSRIRNSFCFPSVLSRYLCFL
jgi:hypothetical protein